MSAGNVSPGPPSKENGAKSQGKKWKDWVHPRAYYQSKNEEIKSFWGLTDGLEASGQFPPFLFLSPLKAQSEAVSHLKSHQKSH